MNLTEGQIKQVEDYLNGSLDEEETLAFENDLKTNIELRDYLEISSQMNDSFDESNWLFAKNKESEDLNAIEDYIKSDEAQQTKRLIENISKSQGQVKVLNARYYYYVIAACLMLFLGISFVFNFGTSQEELYSEYSDYSNLPSFVSRSNNTEIQLANAETLFKNKHYEEALNIFQTSLNASNEKGSIYIYIGLSQTELSQYKSAEETFNLLISSDLIDAEKGHWYKALLYLKQEKTEETKQVLNTIISNSYDNHEKAKALLNDLPND
ncbi:tol-pal system YbgF family protein [Psychroserpens sp. SPM9]|uniref:tetratricopeptide repeat protein n=1 Tax=Psychroserpens sp. SPM9 TaxID=2975598 RepID=UPI0021A88031|nr:hypothetical protein [Psychroserpens sp. SPM9]MDG5492524.1 hypothetical protein [Psychroserpens sp. SPM9]